MMCFGNWNAALAFGVRTDQLVDIRPSSGARPILFAFSMAAELKGKSFEESELRSHHVRGAQNLSPGDPAAPAGGPANRMRRLMQDAGAPAAIREFMDSGGKLDVLRQADLSAARVSSGIKCWGLICDLKMIPHFPPTELPVLRWRSFLPPGRTSRMYPAHLVKACQLNDCDAT